MRSRLPRPALASVPVLAVLWALAALFVLAAPAAALVVFDNGLVNTNVGIPDDEVIEVYDSTSGQVTTLRGTAIDTWHIVRAYDRSQLEALGYLTFLNVDLADQARLQVLGYWAGGVKAYDQSVVDVYDVIGGASAYQDAQINFHDGFAYQITLNDDASLLQEAGLIDSTYLYGSSFLMRTGGSNPTDGIYLDEQATADIQGGLNTIVDAQGSSQVDLRGGSFAGFFGGTLNALDQAIVRIYGSGFTVDGSPVPYGALSALSGSLDGTFANGDPLALVAGDTVDFTRGVNAQIILMVPEPAAAVLAAAGVALLACRRRRRAA